MTIQNFAKFVDAAIVKKGTALFADGKVTALEEAQEGLWVATVEDKKEECEVEVLLHKNTARESLCYCTSGNGKICSHVVATFLAIDAKKQQGKAIPKPKNLSFAKLVESIPLAELQNFLTSYAAKNKVFKNDFELHFVERNPTVDFEKVFTEIVEKSIKARSKEGGISNATEVGKEIKKHLKTAETYIGEGNYRDSFSILKILYLKIYGMSEKMYLNTTIIKYCTKIVENIGFIVAYDKVPISLKETIFEYYKQLIGNDNVSCNIFKESFFKDIDTLAFKLQKTDEYLALLDKKLAGLKKSHENSAKLFFILKKIALLTKMGNKKKEREALIDAHLFFPEVRELRAQEYIDSGNYLKARNLLLDGIAQTNFDYLPRGRKVMRQWEEMLLFIAEKIGDMEKVRYYAQRFAFNQEEYSSFFYEKWKATFEKKEFNKLITKMILKLEKEASDLLEKQKKWEKDLLLMPEELKKLCFIYKNEGFIDKLWKVVKDSKSDFIIEYLPFLKDYKTEEVRDRLFEHIAYDLKTAFSYTQYERIAMHLKTIADTFKDKTSQDKLKELIAVYKESYKNKKALMNLLNTIDFDRT